MSPLSPMSISACHLSTGEFIFDVDDATTYEILCRLNLCSLVSKLSDLKDSTSLDPANAPLSFKKVSADKIGLVLAQGVIALLDLSQLNSGPARI